MKTDIINKTTQYFQLKEGNAGAFRFLTQLDPESKFSIKVDPNATYREYMVATGKKGESIILTSDDFSEYEVITIGEDPETHTTYTSTPSKPRKSGSPSAEPSSAEVKSPHGAESKVGGESEAGVESDPPASISAGTRSAPPGSSVAGVPSALPGPSVARGEPALGISNQNDRVPWYRKKKWFQ